MKILVICQYYYPEQFRINDICETLVKEGHDITVITGLPNYPKGKLFDGYSFFSLIRASSGRASKLGDLITSTDCTQPASSMRNCVIRLLSPEY